MAEQPPYISTQYIIHKMVRIFAHPVLFFYALPWLMCLLVFGTIAQRYIGLYQSEKLFFGSFLLWFGPIPLPGAYLTLSAIALSLIAKLALKSPFKKKAAGTLITHISALVLLAGALITTLCREEGYMLLGDGETSHAVSDYHQRELAIFKNRAFLMAIPQHALTPDNLITAPNLPFSVHITRYCYPCATQPRTYPAPSLRGSAQKIELVPISPREEDGENQSGVIFEMRGVSTSQDGTYISFQSLAQQPAVTIGTDHYDITIRPVERLLPFDIRLIHFDKSNYPGTSMARSYRSDVAVKDGALEWKTAIEMNQPLRYRGYTFYQSSFVNNSDGRLMTVLAVVKDAGQLFPYLAITMLCLGLLVHLVMHFSRKRSA